MKVTPSVNSLRLYSQWNSPGQNTGVGSLSFLQGIFPTQGSNSRLLPCKRILYLLCHKKSSRILEPVAYPSPGDHPNPGIKPGSPALQADSLPTELSEKPIFAFLLLDFGFNLVPGHSLSLLDFACDFASLSSP